MLRIAFVSERLPEQIFTRITPNLAKISAQNMQLHYLPIGKDENVNLTSNIKQRRAGELIGVLEHLSVSPAVVPSLVPLPARLR